MERPMDPEILEALEEVERMKKDPTYGKTYTDIDLMFEEILNSDDDDDEEDFNEETQHTMENAERGRELSRPFSSFEEMAAYLDAEEADE